ncbi:MAG: TetR/AcrR family transcriptional regulator [Lachnospiraceae bacterium]|nr:TetR/AcrR family transcriptional regulator [Lachnospiraceae bacterium]
MPPKAKITKDMIVETAFQIAREEGADKITVRSIAERLNCSTQPVLYYFSTIEEIRKLVYERADEFHSNYIMAEAPECEDAFMGIGFQYIRFAMEERNLFKLLFQSNEFTGTSILDLMNSEELEPLYASLEEGAGLSKEEAKEVFAIVFIYVHGYASLFANNTLHFDADNIIEGLDKTFYGAIGVAKGAFNEEII